MSHDSVTSQTRVTHSEDLETLKMSADHGRLAVVSCGRTDVGKARSSNEDQFLVATLTKALQIDQSSLRQSPVHYSHEQGHLFVVADGMGGHAGGAKASALALDSIEEFTLNTLKWFFHLTGGEGDAVLAEFQRALAQADSRLFAEAAKHPELQGMGTTMTMAYSINNDLFVVHAGDSRCYLLRDGLLHRLTRDHTLVQEMVRRGVLEPENAAHHQLRHVISNVLGGTKPGVQVEVHKVNVAAGDTVLLCSDGLTEMVPEAEICQILQMDGTTQNTCQRLVDQANHYGGKDNVTVIVAHYTEASASQRQPCQSS